MADETPPPAAPGPPDRRRPAPTIDLEATEIATGAAATGPEQAPPLEPSSLEQEGEARMPPKSAVHRTLSGLAAAVSWPLVGAGLAGAILTLGIVWVVALGTRQGNEASLADARIAQLERQLADLAGHVRADPADSAPARDLANRLQQLEAGQAAAVPDPALASRIAAIEAQLKSLGETVGALGQRSASVAAANAAALNELTQKLARSGTPETQSNDASNASPDANAAALAALGDRVDALEGTAKSTETTLAAELAKRNAEISDDHAVRTAVIAAALTAAVERGRPFVAELKAAQSQSPDASALAPLEVFAAAGVPNVNALVRELSGLEPALRQAAGAVPSEAGFLEKLQANAERLVRIRPIEEVAGDDPAAVIARIEFKAVRGDLPGALTEFDKLPATVRAPAQAWIAKAQARAAALAASRAFAADALVALAQPSH
jgi:hypothetical protein